MWKTNALVAQRVHYLADNELTLLIYTQVKGKAKQMLELPEIEDLEGTDGFQLVWRILDQAHEKMQHERADAYMTLGAARRKHGQSTEE